MSWHQSILLVGRLLKVVAVVLFFGLTSTSFNSTAWSTEYGKNVYLPGIATSLAGVMPPPGTYGSSITYFYSGSASGAAANGFALDVLGNIDLQADIDVDADIIIDVPTVLWVLPQQVLGGKFGFGVLVPIGWQDASVDANVLASLTLPNGNTFSRGAKFELDDDTFAFGDPLLTAFLGWNQGNWHWKVAGLLNVPIGSYDKTNLVNMGFNHWAFDASGSVTWLDPARGHEVSATAGFTFNGENDDTNYTSGTEFHVEFALMQHFSKAFAAGVAGYFYDQVTGDSGPGATLGSFKGRVTAIGPNINYNFQWGQIPVATSLRWLHEFNAKNRLEGDAGFLTVTIPLGVPRS